MSNTFTLPFLSAKRTSGFTIVELLIVIIVIGILAALVLVGYSNVKTQATTASVASDASNAVSVLPNFAVNNGDKYPADTAAAQAAGISTSGSNTLYNYIVDNSTVPAFACVTIKNGTIYKYASTTTAASDGLCPQLNLVLNPNFDTNVNGVENRGCGAGGACADTQTNDGVVGKAATQSWSVAATGGGSTLYTGSIGGAPQIPVLPNTTYTASAYCMTSKSAPVAIEDNMAGAVGSPAGISSTPNQWARYSSTFTTTSSATTVMIGCRVTDLSGTDTTFTIKMDQAMLTLGTDLYKYADGNSTGWKWNGTVNGSTSLGPLSL